MSDNDPVAAFRVEAGELLEQVERALLDLTEDAGNRDLIDEVFRGLHTLKGSGAMFGFDALAGFTHHCETAFDRVRKGVAPASRTLIDVVLSALDYMHALTEAGADADAELVAAGDGILGALARAVSAAPEAPVALTPASLQGWDVRFRLPLEAMATGSNPLGLLDELRDLGDCTVICRCDDLPAFADLDPTQCHARWEVTLTGAVSREDIEDVFVFVIDDMDLTITPLAAPPAAGEASADAPPLMPPPPMSPRARSRAVPPPRRRKACGCRPSGSTS